MYSLLYAWEGLVYFIKYEIHARIHLAFALLVLFFGWVCSISSTEWLIIIGCIGLVIQAEIWNTVFELLLDYVSPQWHIKVKVMKDIAAAGVLCCVVISIILGLIIFVPYLYAWWMQICEDGECESSLLDYHCYFFLPG